MHQCVFCAKQSISIFFIELRNVRKLSLLYLLVSITQVRSYLMYPNLCTHKFGYMKSRVH